MPLAFIGVGRRCRIKCVTGDDSVRKHLGALGFAVGTEVEIVSEMDGNLIIGVMGSRVAVDRDMAKRILV